MYVRIYLRTYTYMYSTYVAVCTYTIYIFALVQISFQSSVLGEFCEEFVWNVNRATEPLKLTIQYEISVDV